MPYRFAGLLWIVYCITHISHNDLPELPSAALSSISVATATPHSSALQSEKFIRRHYAESE